MSRLLPLWHGEDGTALTHAAGRAVGKCSGVSINQGLGSKDLLPVGFSVAKQRTLLTERSKYRQ